MAKSRIPIPSDILPPTENSNGSNGNGNGHGHSERHVVTVNGMYQNYFLDYASYVILDRAVPAIEDGLKPVQRRILHAMFEMEDGRYHKVANIIGQTMQFHPHGDAAIGDALVNLGQKELMIDTQGNWGDYRTGDDAAAPRYIEARLSKFALEVAFNPQTTEWQLSYDGRKREPINLPMKFPLVLAQGVDGIAVGLSTKILPHNFIELCKASIDILKGKPVRIYPDFMTGGMVDVSDYRNGERGGKIKSRAKIEKIDKQFLMVKELPYGVTVKGLCANIEAAVEKGQIKIKKVTDITAADVGIEIELVPGTSPDVTIDALYAFTDCEVSISPNACVIADHKPIFTNIQEILRISTENTKDLLRRELLIREHELLEKWHFASLEKIFIEKRVYHKIEECESFEEVLDVILAELDKYVVAPEVWREKGFSAKDKRLRLMRAVTEDDAVRLTEIKIKRISKYNSFKADELIADTEKELAQVRHDLEELTEYTVAYFENLLKKYGKGRERRTEISGGSFETIQASAVVANNAKLYVNRKEGFFGMGLKKDEFVCDCSDIDDIIVFTRDGKCKVSKIADKVFAGKDILHLDVWKKNDERTTYNAIYLDGKSGKSFGKRFNVTAVTRDKEYDLTQGTPNSKVLYFSANPNGEAEIVNITLSPACPAKLKIFDYGFSDLAIKGRGSMGNVVTKYPVKKVALKEAGQSTIGARQIYMDEVSGRLSMDDRGRHLGAFDTGDVLLAVYADGTYEMTELELTKRFELKDLVWLGKFDPDLVISAVHYDGNKEWTMVKRFRIETSKLDERFSFISEHKTSRLLFASTKPNPRIHYTLKVKNVKMDGEVSLGDFIEVKGWKAMGNRLSEQKLTSVKELESKEAEKPVAKKEAAEVKLHAGDTVEFEVEKSGQTKLF